MAIDISELLEPISGGDPCGEDVSFADVLDQMREARRADDPGLPQGDWQTTPKVADWRLVLQLGEKVLSTQSKDLQAAVWVGEAAIGRDGFGGAADAFALLSGLVEKFWDGLYPRLEGDDAEERASKLAWFNTYAGRALRSAPLTDTKPAMTLNLWATSREVDNLARQNAEAHRAALDEGKPGGDVFDKALVDSPAELIRDLLAKIEAGQAAFAQMKTRVDAKFGRTSPSLADIEDALKRALQIVTKAAKAKGLVSDAAAEEPSDSDAASTSTAAPSAGGGFSLQFGASASGRQTALKALSEIAAFFRKTEPHSPVSFLVERAVAWADTPLDQWLAQVVSDDGVLSRIRDRTGIAT
ncbi:MAG: tssA [Hydrocarboniphaga sp.]|uniref:type VI secretion system protein TssA n=1 Tax=Hydrocarboniphaga sp. TaxID=2033016 RepID=UPI00261F53A6|nr:type VI secretion system protein TssA [Hydrocarboniphaga sp.]MDB5968199.1 tssA [Hydrocarboniphaga sp.]